MKNWVLILLLAILHMTAYADELPVRAIQLQKTDQQTCVDNKLPECLKKCDTYSEDIHCHGLCKLNIINECRDAGE